jgi:Animal haem peroxidase
VTTTAPAAHAVRDHCLAPERRVYAPAAGGRYGRMFRQLEPFLADESRLHELGIAGGFCDGGDCDDDAAVEAGWPFFGQFVAHDITADRSPLRAHADLEGLRNMRSPRANLESLYGGGPGGSPYLYCRDDPARLLEEDSDLPRNSEGIALIGDPRNDVHVFMSQMHLGFIRAHNLLVDRLRDDGVEESGLFDEARRALAWHYQWVIVNDFLPGLVGAELVSELLSSGTRFYRPDGEPFIPVEFADAAYRYGHSQIRQHYLVQMDGEPMAVFPDLVGFGPVTPERHVDWALLFDVPGRERAQRAKPIDGRLPRSLIALPDAITGGLQDGVYRSLATRDLERGQGTGLPSGEAVAGAIGVAPLTEKEIDLRRAGWEVETPLWLYVLRESLARGGGDRLGDVGGTIVAEVLVGIIEADPESYLALEPDWRPTLSGHEARFRLRDLLVPATNGSSE